MEIKRCYDTIIGASVGENQLAYNGNFADGASGWGDLNTPTRNIVVENGVAKITATEATEYLQFITNSSFYDKAEWLSGHKYFVSLDWKSSVPATSLWSVLYSGWTNLGAKRIDITGSTGRHEEFFLTPNANSSNNARFMFQVGGASFASGDYATIDNVMITDLTAELGSSIADYIYNLETATAGSGISKLREWGFLKGYQAHNAGSIESVEVTGKVVRGFNQWNEEWEVGYINPTTGEATSATDRIRTKNFNPCLQNTAYYVKDPTSSNNVRIFYYDADKNFVSETGWNGNQILTTPSNAYFFKFIMGASYGTTYNYDICINLSNPDRNGEYEPYTSQSYDYGDDTLRGIFKLDANNNLYADGDVKTSDGTITRKYGIVDLGTLTWGLSNNGNYFQAVFPLSADGSYGGLANVICSKYPTISTPESLYNGTADKVMIVNTTYISSTKSVFIMDSAYSDAASFKTAMSGVYLVYELATPTTEQGDPFPSPQVCYPDGTEEYITGNGVPVGHETRYEL